MTQVYNYINSDAVRFIVFVLTPFGGWQWIRNAINRFSKAYLQICAKTRKNWNVVRILKKQRPSQNSTKILKVHDLIRPYNAAC